MPQLRPFAASWRNILSQGYSPLPQRGQACRVRDWSQYCREPLSEVECQRFAASPIAYNIGVALGYRGLVACDRDTDDARVVESLRPIFSAIYARGGVPVAKFGSKGLTSFFRWVDAAPFRNRSFASPELGTFFELSGPGRSTTIPPSIHPKTGRPYTSRTVRTVRDTYVDELPALDAGDVRAIERALSPFLPPPKAAPIARASVNVVDLDERQLKRHAAYARTIIERESAALAAMPADSGRNRRAFDLACRVGRYVVHGVIEREEVAAPILRACEANGLAREGRAAVVKTIHSGLLKASNDALPDLPARVGGRR